MELRFPNHRHSKPFAICNDLRILVRQLFQQAPPEFIGIEGLLLGILQ